MKTLYLFIYLPLISIAFTNCVSKQSKPIPIDLDRSADAIPYSAFVDEIEYRELNTRDSCILSEIEKIYIDNDTLLIQDKLNGGILTFDRKGKLISQINFFGEGPEEFISITTFCIDPEKNIIYIWDYPSQKIKKYTYQGDFIGADKSEFFVRDFTVLKDGNRLCVFPCYSEYLPSGIWISDKKDQIVKDFQVDVPQGEKIEFAGTNYNIDHDSIFIYDRNHDYLYCLVNDSLQVKYAFKPKQVLDKELRKKDPSNYQPLLKEIAYMSNFSLSNQYLLQTYKYLNNPDDPYRFVLYDRKNGRAHIGKDLLNDIDNVPSTDPHVYYLDKNTWCRVVETDVNNCDILLQLLRIKGSK